MASGVAQPRTQHFEHGSGLAQTAAWRFFLKIQVVRLSGATLAGRCRSTSAHHYGRGTVDAAAHLHDPQMHKSRFGRQVHSIQAVIFAWNGERELRAAVLERAGLGIDAGLEMF